jgi:hypothetical protein
MIKFKPENLNDTTKCYSRTLREAFPDAPSPTFDKTDTLILRVCGVAAMFLALIFTMGW